MRSLRKLQEEFGQSILDAANSAPFRPGLGLYVGNVYGNWTKALISAYPVVRKIVGEPFFEDLARAYARACPSGSGDLNAFGESFPAFVSRFPQTRDLPYLPDVARLEWHAHRAYFAANAKRFDAARLAAVPPGEQSSLRLSCAPGSALLASEWPLARLWEVHQDGYCGDPGVDLEPSPGRYVVFRPRWHATVESITNGEFRFLSKAIRGATLGAALGAALASDAEFVPASALARWVGKGVITL